MNKYCDIVSTELRTLKYFYTNYEVLKDYPIFQSLAQKYNDVLAMCPNAQLVAIYELYYKTGKAAFEVADMLGISANHVYKQVEKLKLYCINDLYGDESSL